MPRKKLMVTSNLSPKKRKTWNTDNMKRAVQAVREKSMGTLKAAKTFGVPRTTVQRLAKMDHLSVEQAVQIKLGRGTVLNSELEETLVRYILEMEVKFYGLTRKDIKRMAFNLAEINGINHPFGNTKAAGRGWLDLFLHVFEKKGLRIPCQLEDLLGRLSLALKGLTKRVLTTFLHFWRKSMKSTIFQLIACLMWMRLA